MHLSSCTPVKNRAQQRKMQVNVSFDLRHELETFAYSMLSVAVCPYSYFSLKILFELFLYTKKGMPYYKFSRLFYLAMELAVLRA